MRSLIKLILILLLGVHVARAQDKLVRLTPAMFNRINELLICDNDGWVFKEGNDIAWSASDLDISGWKQLKPTELTASMADKDGRLEGWLRVSILFDSAFQGIPLSLRYYGWAAAELYIDGHLIKSYGNTGINGQRFGEFNPSNILPVPVNLQPGVKHSIAIHMVDYISPFSGQLKSETTGLNRLLRFTGPAYYAKFAKHIRSWPVYSTLWISMCCTLLVLFWLLAFLNRREKNLLLFASAITLFTLTNIFKVVSESNQISFVAYKLYFWGFLFFNIVGSCVTIIIVAKVFRQNVPRKLKIFLLLFLAAGIAGSFVSVNLVFLLANFIPVIVYTGYIISSWKKLKGAQWAIVAGTMSTLVFTVLYAGMIVAYQTDFIPYNMEIASCLILSVPLSLLVYIALRFKEIVAEVQQNAQRVVQLSEEKKEQAIHQQKILEEEVARQTIELRTSLENLKSTQSQLIQSEKMASLGELTAGIAHEIQNPLNFVNNFSEVSSELIDEMNTELSKGDINEAKAIAADVKQNLEKINYHGKRADAIVKGMLQHTRSSSGVKEPTDINALADEYLRLVYHGLRAKDNSFNAALKTDFDESIGKINIIPQDIGRVILNLITNAFYAAALPAPAGGGFKDTDYKYNPTVSVSTKKVGDKVLISVKDNGPGIPKKIVDKIFQPFFTTKPTGQGTGLGLSLSYDIVKAHGGEIKVNTKENEGTEFIISLPL